MATWKRFTVAFLGMTILSSLCIPSAEAKPGKGKPGEQSTVTQPIAPSTTEARPGKGRKGNGEQPTVTQPVAPAASPTTSNRQEALSFSATQRTQLMELLSGKVVREEVLDVGTRNLIASQVSSLPPGIQKQLARGKGLPPGIAKKVVLPKTVNTYLKIPAQYDLVVVGSSVALYNSVTSIVSDLITRFI